MAAKCALYILSICCIFVLISCQDVDISSKPSTLQPTQGNEEQLSSTPLLIQPEKIDTPLVEATPSPIIIPTEISTLIPISHVTEENGALRSDKKRDMPPVVSDAQLKTLVQGNSIFSFELYPMLQPKGENFFYSPYSISLAMAMVYGGARGETAQQMADVLHFAPLQDKIHETFFTLESAILQREKDNQGGEGFILRVANSIWGQTGRPFEADYLDFLSQNYFAELHLADFAQQPDEVRLMINKWVSEQTEDKIQELFPENTISPSTTMVLTNAIYFKANWENQFDPTLTKADNFFYLVGGQTGVPMMQQTATFDFVQTAAYKAVELPYQGGELSMLVMMPIDEQSNKNEKAFQDFEKSFNLEKVDAIVKELEPRLLTLSLPKFKLESEYLLSDYLIKMGMLNAFAPLAANFSGIDGTRELYLEQVVHKTFIQVDENGTEAAAATGGGMKLTAIETETPLVVLINHPFIFVIRDHQTGSILFFGRVFKPTL